MTIKKITPGFVIQTWNVETQKWTHQEFIAGDEYTYEDEHGNLATVDDMVPPSYAEPYLNFGMIQPEL